MLKIFVICIFTFLMMQYVNSYCLNYRDPFVLELCSCTEPIFSGVVNCGNACGPCSDANICRCSMPCSCIKDTSNPCEICEGNKSPVCSCLSSIGVSCNDKRSFIYFPEVEYPMTIVEMNPNFYFSTCYFK